jgi:hypothetical protein
VRTRRAGVAENFRFLDEEFVTVRHVAHTHRLLVAALYVIVAETTEHDRYLRNFIGMRYVVAIAFPRLLCEGSSNLAVKLGR